MHKLCKEYNTHQISQIWGTWSYHHIRPTSAVLRVSQLVAVKSRHLQMSEIWEFISLPNVNEQQVNAVVKSCNYLIWAISRIRHHLRQQLPSSMHLPPVDLTMETVCSQAFQIMTYKRFREFRTPLIISSPKPRNMSICLQYWETFTYLSVKKRIDFKY